MQPELNIPTLIFHSIDKFQSSELFSVSPEQFDDFIGFIQERFGILDFRKVREAIKSGKANTVGKGVLITFDDGYQNNFDQALPVLEKYQAKAVFFIPPKFIGKNNLWNTKAYKILDHMPAQEIQALIDTGHTIGSHGITHHRLTKFDDQTVMFELAESKQLLEDMFSISVDTFSYPYGSTNKKIARLASGVYEYCFSDDQAPVGWQTSKFSQIRREYVWPRQTIENLATLITKFGTFKNNPYA